MSCRRGEIDRLAKQRVEEYLRRSSITYLECCISLMLTHLSPEEAAAILEAEAAIVRELG